MDYSNIRTRLNELPFQLGRRQVLIGRVSEILEQRPEDVDVGRDGDDENSVTAAAVEQRLHQIRQELSARGLELQRGAEDRDELYALQRLKLQSEVDLSWLGEAMSWSARIMAVGLEMVLPVVAGMWLDARLGTRFMALIGICVGLPVGLWHILVFTRGKRSGRHSQVPGEGDRETRRCGEPE